MEIVRYFLIVVEILTCLLLVAVILLQQSKSQGMGVAFGGGMSESLFGSRAGNILTKTTIVLAVIFLANTTLLGIMYTQSEDKSLLDRVTAPAPLPVAPQAGADMFSAPPVQPREAGMFPSFENQDVSAQAFEDVADPDFAPVESVIMPVDVPDEAEPVTP
ncbi:MAG TPA: preprotein translocase subunit SecG [Kiritimatiellia bacterium]|nr:preprotein translocase subunit SecG [Kiritimatiellia bacterium]